MTVSIFENDPFRRALRRVRLTAGPDLPLVKLSLLVAVAGYLAPLALAFIAGRAVGPTARDSFLRDVNFPVQVLAVILLFVAEGVIDRSVRKSGHLLGENRIVKDPRVLASAAEKLRHRRESLLAESVVIVIAVVFTLTWLFPAIASGIPTWQLQPGTGGALRPTLAGWWVILTWGPFFQYVVVRWVWKYVMWVAFLVKISRSELRILVGHPDRAGGLSFLGDLQGRFGYVVFAIGLVVLANDYVVLSIRGTQHLRVDILASTLGFIVGAPLLFLTPLLFFTRKLMRAKEAALASYHVVLTRLVGAMERRYLRTGGEALDEMLDDFSGFADTQSLYENLKGLRVYPFDFGTVKQLFASAVAPMLPVFAQFVPWEPLRSVLRAFGG